MQLRVGFSLFAFTARRHGPMASDGRLAGWGLAGLPRHTGKAGRPAVNVARILDQAEAQLTLFQPPGIRPTISKQAGPLKIDALIGYGKGAQTATVKG